MTIRPIARRSIPAAIRVAVATVALLSFLGLLAVIVRSNVLAGREYNAPACQDHGPTKLRWISVDKSVESNLRIGWAARGVRIHRTQAQ